MTEPNDGSQCDDILVSSYNGDSDLEDGHVGIWKKVGRLGKVPKKWEIFENSKYRKYRLF